MSVGCAFCFFIGFPLFGGTALEWKGRLCIVVNTNSANDRNGLCYETPLPISLLTQTLGHHAKCGF